MATLDGPTPAGANFELYEAHDEAAGLYSCVFLYTGSWNPGWPALGGTRNINVAGGFHEVRAECRAEAKELAASMAVKNTLLRQAAQAAFGAEAEQRPFGWNGGKGVVWSPERAALSPERLMLHGQLVERMAGRYIASKDAGVGTAQLRWLERATQYTIGNGCQRDTGEGTAAGVVAGICTALHRIGRLDSEPNAAALLTNKDGERPLAGARIFIAGLGKVGIPLALYLDNLGAEVHGYDTLYEPGRAEALYERTRSAGGAVGDEHRGLLARMEDGGRIHRDEAAALADPRFDVISPNGGRVSYLAADLSDRLAGSAGFSGPTRAERLADTRRGGGALSLVVGACNDQLPATAGFKSVRDDALAALSDAGVAFIPDPVVSPGGVVAVSHELLAEWNADAVVADACRMVQAGTAILCDAAGAEPSAARMYEAFEGLHGIAM